jgi:glycosyltransferase involved in cell wall biosynthesis
LACTLRSVLAQREVDMEVIVVDDASARPVAPLEDARVRVVRHDTVRGVSAARNSGIGVATGEWVAFCDDDDVWAPNKLSAELAAAAEVGAEWVYAGEVTVDEDLRILGGGPPLPPRRMVQLLSRYNAVPGSASSVAVTAGVLATIGGFDTSLRRTEDWDMWLRLARRGMPAWTPNPLVAIRQHLANVILDRDSIIREPAILARRHGILIDPLAARRRAAWDLLRAGRRRAAAREYAGVAARGDLASLGRAVLALVYPGIGTRRLFSLTRVPSDPDWTERARVWLEPLAERCAG